MTDIGRCICEYINLICFRKFTVVTLNQSRQKVYFLNYTTQQYNILHIANLVTRCFANLKQNATITRTIERISQYFTHHLKRNRM